MKPLKYIFPQHGDERGQLVAIEELKDIPFEIKRVYYMYDTLPGVKRGGHSHKTLEQILICVHGACKVLLDDGKDKEIILLDKPNAGLYVPCNTWHEMYDFEEGTVLMVLASQLYNEEDYIRSYDVFLKSLQ